MDAPRPPVPTYLTDTYGWAYVHPRSLRVFEREWLVNLILFGHYARLGDAALDALAGGEGLLRGRTLQIACVYGSLSERLRRRLDPGAALEVVDILPIQLANLQRKLAPDVRVVLRQADSARLGGPDAAYDQVLLFFLLHEQPAEQRRATLAEAMRVLRPGGRLVVVDYHRPRWWHPARPLLRLVFAGLEPFAIDLWRRPIEFEPAPASLVQRRFFGGLYQLLVLTR